MIIDSYPRFLNSISLDFYPNFGSHSQVILPIMNNIFMSFMLTIPETVKLISF
jgi:hypothetical protein